ncbi:MAG: redox-regulated ATPase YchF [Verrucomicrobia bacterium]|nr:redox-regulated ATPase YchF [Verrucomicrobiota bacterium]
MWKAGIVGLPNVGKSTLFNALVRARQAQAEAYPFCTIEPNLGVVPVPDPRLDALARIAGVERRVPAAVEFVDIAGLVRGASRGEGLGNRFLSHIREVDLLVHVVRCFEEPDVPHAPGELDPVRDIDIVMTELVLADLESVDRQLEKARKDAKRGDKRAVRAVELLAVIRERLDAGKPARAAETPPEAADIRRDFFLLTDKPILFAANVAESDAASEGGPLAARARRHAAEAYGAPTVALSAGLESELGELDKEEAAEYLRELGLDAPGGDRLIREACRLLDLITFFTFNEKEARAWMIPAGTGVASAAGRIHTDMEEGFIRAEVVPWSALAEAGSVPRAREAGHYRVEGRDYLVQDGDVILIRFRS